MEPSYGGKKIESSLIPGFLSPFYTIWKEDASPNPSHVMLHCSHPLLKRHFQTWKFNLV